MPLTQKQMGYLALAWQCFETEPKIDYDKFHKLAGLSSVASARELMRVTKNKLKTEYGALGSGLQAANTNTNTSSPTKAKGTPKKGREATPGTGSRKRAKKAQSEGEVDDNESPSKKSKVKTEAEEGEGEE